MEYTLFKSVGTLRYGYKGGDYNLVVDVDQGLADYYRSLIPKSISFNRQKYPPHISVVRKEVPINLDLWGKYNGHEIEFVYSNVIRWGQVYYWLDVFSTRLEEIRLELGLPVSSQYTLPPDGFVKCFHCSLCNRKGL